MAPIATSINADWWVVAHRSPKQTRRASRISFVLDSPMTSGSAYPHHHAMSATSSGLPLSVSRTPEIQEYRLPGYGNSRAQSPHLNRSLTSVNHYGRRRHWAHKARNLLGTFWKKLRKVGKLFVSRVSEERECWSIEMQIHRQGSEGPENTTPRRGLVDTGSSYELVSERILDELNLTPYLQRMHPITGIEGPLRGILPIGTYMFAWHVAGKREVYNTVFLVISKEIDCQFDFILGTGWIKFSGAVRRNSDVMFAY